MRREAEQAARAASVMAAEEAASAEASETAGTAKPTNCLAVACDRVQARFEREEAKRTACIGGPEECDGRQSKRSDGEAGKLPCGR